MVYRSLTSLVESEPPRLRNLVHLLCSPLISDNDRGIIEASLTYAIMEQYPAVTHVTTYANPLQQRLWFAVYTDYIEAQSMALPINRHIPMMYTLVSDTLVNVLGMSEHDINVWIHDTVQGAIQVVLDRGYVRSTRVFRPLLPRQLDVPTISLESR